MTGVLTVRDTRSSNGYISGSFTPRASTPRADPLGATMKRLAAIAALALAVLAPSAAAADPSFGPGAGNGQGNNEPHENPGTKCHPPGQTDDRPECK